METCPPHRGVCALRRRRRRRRRRRWWWWWWGSGEHGCDGGFILEWNMFWSGTCSVVKHATLTDDSAL
jgi:hypothetical protein